MPLTALLFRSEDQARLGSNETAVFIANFGGRDRDRICAPSVAADDSDPFQRGDDGPGLGGRLQLAPQLPRRLRIAAAELRGALPRRGHRGLRPRLHAGDAPGVSNVEYLLALHEF